MRGRGSLTSTRRRVALGLVAAAAVVAFVPLVAPGSARRMWQRAYPLLPARLQAVPYVLEARIAPRVGTPVPVPTAAPLRQATTPNQAGGERVGAAPRSTHAPGVVAAGATPRWAERPATGVTLPATAPATVGAPLPRSAAVPPIRHEYQTWNNCGPATISMALSAYGDREGQRNAAVRLKPDPDDKNVSPHELARYAHERGFRADVIVGGDVALLQRLLAGGVVVIVETWFEPDPGDEMGHYRLLTGYDAVARTFSAADSFHGPGLALDWDTFDADWRVFNRVLVPVYAPAVDAVVAEALGPRGAPATMWLMAEETAVTEIATSEDAFGWFNLGGSLVGRDAPVEAATAFDRARALGLPWRMLWYQFGPYEAYAASGRWDEVEALAESTLATVDDLEESLYWRGRAREARGDAAGARADFERARLLNPLWDAPRASLDALATPGQ